MPNALTEAIANMQESEAINLATQMLEAGEDAMRVLDHCRKGLEMVGREFETGKYFLPELILSGEILKNVSEIAKPYIQSDAHQKDESRGKVVIGSVKGDIHDIGKDIVAFMLEVNGFEVIDLGVDVPADNFVGAIQEYRPAVVGMSALLTTAVEAMKNTVDVITEAGCRDQVKIMVGGGAVDEKVLGYAGADDYGPDAVVAVKLTQQWVAHP